ncbi:DoxX family membrane protein [Adhaeribacter terrigena]|nr:DoxX family membrane protein [Adhaeribacter terrigena]
MTNPQLAHLILRLGLGVNMLMHGLTRVFNLSGFAEKMAAGFTETVLPYP